MKPASKILIVEVDGGTWDVMKPLVDKGRLPNIKGLMDRGSWGVLRSEQPMISPRIWTSIFTGKSSEKHGVEFFGDSAKSVRQKRLWDIFNDQGNKVGVVGSLVTWPPYPINGFIIPSVFAMGPETYPEEYSSFQEVVLRERRKLTQKASRSGKLFAILKAVKGLQRNGISNSTFLYMLKYFLWEKAGSHTPLDKYWRKATIYHRMLTELFINLYKRHRPEFATFHVHLCDAISHRYWESYEPEKFSKAPDAATAKFAGVIPEAYMELDRTVGAFLDMIDDDTSVVLVSDHGFGAMPDAIQPHILDIERFLKILGLENSVIPARFGIKVYLTFPSRDKEEMARAKGVIEKIAFAGTKESIFKVDQYERYLSIQTTTKLWRTDVNDDTEVSVADLGTYRFADLFPTRKLRVTGVHKDNGIFLFHGKGVKRGSSLGDASIMDVAPTVLALAGYPVAKDMDGSPVKAIFTKDFLKEHPIRYVESYESGEAASGKEEPVDYAKMRKRLESLGYM